MKVAVLGGSFNPIHNSHLKLSNYLVQNNIVDEVWVMPCKKHPLDKIIDKEEDRVAMVKLALNEKTLVGVKFSDFELNKSGKSYTYETLRGLKENYPHDFSWIIGSDILRQISTWYGYEILQKEAKFIVFKREGYSTENPGLNIEAIMECETESISSTKIRDRVRKGKSISDLVPKSVEDYILRNKMYRN
jgi:nicotinate-nucleotide adenylyltransferase